MWLRAVCLALVAGICSVALADEPITLANALEPAPNRSDEPLAESYSRSAAERFLDTASLWWQNEHQCFTCHTNYAFLYARPSAGRSDSAAVEVRRYAEELVAKRWVEDGPRWDAEIVATAAALSFNDAATNGKLHATTRAALDRMWTRQRPDGGWSWLNCDWPPMESDDHYGACLAALAVSAAPDGYNQTPAARAGLSRLREYFAANPPPTVHHGAMLLWASCYGEKFLAEKESRDSIDKLRGLERPGGGWATSSLGNWQRADGSPQSTDSDGYGTGFVVYVLRQAGIAAADPAIVRGVAWLKANQRASGRWFTRSLHQDGRHYLTHAGTAFALMALNSCEPAVVAAETGTR